MVNCKMKRLNGNKRYPFTILKSLLASRPGCRVIGKGDLGNTTYGASDAFPEKPGNHVMTETLGSSTSETMV